MSEAEAIARADKPATVESIAAELAALGVRAGDTLLVHSSLSALGWVCGGPVAVIEALLGVLATQGTLVMPAHSTGNSDPSRWENPPVPRTWWSTIRARMPAFDPARTPTLGMGVIAETFRTWPGVTRSDHPTSSMTAIGPNEQALLERHLLDDHLGEDSPLGRLYELDAKVLLLGVGYDRNTSLHLSERRAFGERHARIATGCAVRRDGRRHWVEYTEPLAHCDDFPLLGAELESDADCVARGNVGAAVARLMRQRPLVDFGVAWLLHHRDPDGRPADAL